MHRFEWFCVKMPKSRHLRAILSNRVRLKCPNVKLSSLFLFSVSPTQNVAASADVGQYIGTPDEKILSHQSAGYLGDDGKFVFHFVDGDMSKNVQTYNAGVKYGSGYTKESFDWKNPAVWVKWGTYNIQGFLPVKSGNWIPLSLALFEYVCSF